MWEIIVAKIALIAPYAGTFGGYVAGTFMFVKWWFDKKRGDETTSLSRIETLSKVEERLRQSLEKQLAVTEAKLELANKEVERLKLLVASHAIEVEKLKAELAIEIAKNKRE